MQFNFTDYEYTHRRKKTRREIFLEKMSELLPWEDWEKMVLPYYPKGNRGRKPQPVIRMLKMFMLKNWFDLSDLSVEEAVYDSYSMKQFLEIDFSLNDQVPDSTTLCKFRSLLKKHDIENTLFSQLKTILKENNMQIKNGLLIQTQKK